MCSTHSFSRVVAHIWSDRRLNLALENHPAVEQSTKFKCLYLLTLGMQEANTVLEEVYSAREEMLNNFIGFWGFVAIALFVSPISSWGGLPENYGIAWVLGAASAVVGILSLRYAKDSVVAHGSVSAMIKSLTASNLRFYHIYIGSIIVMVGFVVWSGQVSQVGMPVISILVLMCVNNIKKVLLASLYDGMNMSDSEDQDLALSANDLSAMSNSELDSLGES